MSLKFYSNVTLFYSTHNMGETGLSNSSSSDSWKTYKNVGRIKCVFIFVGNWKAQLLEDIDADQLPVHWGGTATDPDGDEYCRSKVKPDVLRFLATWNAK